MQLRKNQIVDLQIDSISSDGNGVGRLDGTVVFVPATAVGDVLKVRLTKIAKTHCFGRVEELLAPGPGRQSMDCPIGNSCGGCCFRHLAYSAELKAKEQFVKDALVRIGHLPFEPEAILPSPLENRYRNKVQYPVAVGDGDGLIFGFYAARSHRVVQNPDCLLQPEAVNHVAAYVAACCQEAGIEPYDEATKKGLLRHITLRMSQANGQILLCLVLTRPALPGADAFVAKVTARFPQIATIIINHNPDVTNVVYGKNSRAIYGSGAIRDVLGGVPMQLSEHTFAQVNTPAAERLFEVVRAYAAPDANTTLLDLYCGTGVIGLSMARHAKELIGVEIVPQAVESARQNAAEMGAANARFYCEDAGKAAARLAREGLRPDVIVLDPPRKGADAPTLEAVLAMAPKKIVMVSCNPATMARDLAVLAQNGYGLQKVQPVDMFPRTKHVECVILMTQNGDMEPEKHSSFAKETKD